MDQRLIEKAGYTENLYWAFQTFVRHEMWHGEWVDIGALVRMEAAAPAMVAALKKRFGARDFSPRPLEAIQSSKGMGLFMDPADQVLWVALVQAMGSALEEVMPQWSYGSRLNRSEWIDRTGGLSRYRQGWSRRTSARIYRHPTRVWPSYRRHILQAARAMTGLQSEFDVPGFFRGEEGRILLPESTPYLSGPKAGGPASRLYWACFTVDTSRVDGVLVAVRGLESVSSRIGGDAVSIMAQMLDFSWEDKTNGPHPLPGGLAVSGFLSNVAMLPVDRAVMLRLDAEGLTGSVAHFRYDAEHIVIAREQEGLSRWIDAYDGLLAEKHLGTIHRDTMLPMGLRRSVSADRGGGSDHGVRLDAINPLPEVTRPVEIMAFIHNTDYPLLDRAGKREHINRLETLLLDPFPGTGVSERLRIDFSSVLLSRRAADASEPDHAGVCSLERVTDGSADGEAARLLYRERMVSVRQRQRSLLVLLEAAERHPEIPALWSRALGHMRRSGFGSLAPLLDRLPLHRADGPYISALITVRMAREVGTCVRLLLGSHRPQGEREGARAFLDAVAREGMALKDGGVPFVVSAQRALGEALGAAREILCEKGCPLASLDDMPKALDPKGVAAFRLFMERDQTETRMTSPPSGGGRC